MKKKMSNRRFMSIWIPIVSVMVVLAIGANIAGSVFGGILDTSLGRGERHVLHLENVANWDTEYYPQQYTTLAQAREAAERKMYEVVSEGMVLLKNDGVLPLEKGSLVTPFGRGYAHPIYNGNAIGGSIKYTSPEDGITPRQALERQFTLISAAADKQPAQLGREKGMWTQNNGSWFQPITYSGYPDVPVALEGTTRHDVDAFGGDNYILELDVSAYDDIGAEELDRMSGSTGILFISRSGNENADKKSDGYTDGTPHYLALSQNERDMIAWAKAHCQSVVLVVNSSNPVELMPVMQGELEVNAIVWAGHPGDVGFDPLADILCGEVNPSGRLVDLFATDFLKTPSFANLGNFHYTNSESGVGSEPYVEYAEGMYNGYRYYETAYDLKAAGFSYGELNSQGAATAVGEVAYPFGYGLSYTTFDQKILSVQGKEELEVTVSVTNTGDRAGKEVVQLYLNPPYTDLDREMKIEKPTATLIAFAKTGLLKPGESTQLVLRFGRDEMASYCYTRDNGDGTTGCYMLEEGQYVLSLRRNSHEVIETTNWHNSQTIWYDQSNPRPSEIKMQAAMDDDGTLLDVPERAEADNEAGFIAATNLFPYMNEYMNDEVVMLTRANWEATLPFGEKISGKSINQKYIDMFGQENAFNAASDPRLGNVQGSDVYAADPVQEKQKNDLTLISLRGKDFYDEAWDLLLDQLDYTADHDDIRQILTGTSYSTNAIASIGLPQSLHCEGANGVRLDNGDGIGSDHSRDTSSWCMAPEMAATWNTELMREMGEAMGQEALLGGRQGRMAPAMNLHRSPFQGRVFEYYSEDPVLSGKVAAAVVTGTSSSGMFDFIKHFGLNDQETNRASFLHTWATEQVVRELYNKPFEICIREARKTIRYTADENGTVATKVMRGCSAMMGAQNCFGPVVAFANADLMTSLVRDEWNFHGYIITDMYNGSNEFVEMSIRAGTDGWLVWNTLNNMNDFDSPTAKAVIRNALHHVAFTIANSAVLQHTAPGSVVYYDEAPWRIAVRWTTIGITVLAAFMIVWTLLRAADSKKHPDQYNVSKRKAAKAK